MVGLEGRLNKGLTAYLDVQQTIAFNCVGKSPGDGA